MEIRARHKVIIQCDPDIIISSNALHFLPYNTEQNPSYFFATEFAIRAAELHCF